MKATKESKRQKRKLRIRKTVMGVATKPRLNVFRSNVHLFVQLIDDTAHKTILGMSDSVIKGKTKTEKAFALGKLFAEKATAKKVKSIVFDRAGYKFHGRVKSFADGAREGGLQF